MKCTNCGQEVEKDWKFCPNCKTLITTKLENENLETNEQEPTKKIAMHPLISLYTLLAW